MGKMAQAGAGAGIFDKLEPEPHKNGPAPQHWYQLCTWRNSKIISEIGRQFQRKSVCTGTGNFMLI
jgi:hypothetical protein